MHIITILLIVLASLPRLDPIMGMWKADLNASVLPEGFPKLGSQTMVLQLVSGKLQCSTERVSLDGTKTHADFTAAFDGKRYPVTGMSEIATVSLRRYRTFIEADFFSASAPVYSYRMSISSKDDTLIIISIDPVTRATLHARIVYRREPTTMIFPPPQSTAAPSINPISCRSRPHRSSFTAQRNKPMLASRR